MKIEPDSLRIQLAKGASMDRDFILEIENDQVRSIGTMASALETNVAMLTLLPPEMEGQGNQRDVVLVIDCSGSMQGDSIALAKEGVLLALGSLEANERFGLIAFGTSFLQFDKELQLANRKNLDMARRWVNHLSDLGGTDINGALELALKLKGKQAMDILLLTDGQDWQVGESVAKAKADGVRIFSMGIGSAVAEDAVQMMADETGGACELVAPTEDMSERIYRHFKRMRQPQMNKFEITWPGTPLWECRPSRACFAGDAYTIFAALPDASAQEASVRFEFVEQAPQSLTIPLRSEQSCADAIVRLGAKQHLNVLDGGTRQSWAVTYQLITGDTDYLITVERSGDEKAAELPVLQTQPQMLPAGWGGTSSIQVQACMSSVPSQSRNSYDRIKFSIPPSAAYNQTADVPCVVRKRNVTVEDLARQSSNDYNKFIEKLTEMSTHKLFSKMPTTTERLLQLPLPEPLATLISSLMSEGISKDVLIHSFYAALMEHSGRSSLNEKLIAKVLPFLKDELTDSAVIERLRETLDHLWDTRSNGIDRYDIPAFLRRDAD